MARSEYQSRYIIDLYWTNCPHLTHSLRYLPTVYGFTVVMQCLHYGSLNRGDDCNLVFIMCTVQWLLMTGATELRSVTLNELDTENPKLS